MDLTPFFKLAIKNVSKFGDTDIFPFPLENRIINDSEAEFAKLLKDAFSNFEPFFYDNQPSDIKALTPVGPLGFRWASQLDPFWNVFLLGLVLSISEKIEKVRIPKEDNCVFSYRIRLNNKTGHLFEENIGYREFLEETKSRLKTKKLVLVCDIADCYSRIYHHRIENALENIECNTSIEFQIKELLKNFSKGKSYGVPIGGPAARILVELLLNFVDQLLRSHGYSFCRFADDYHIFVDTEEEAYEALLFLSEKLFRNEGLALQKAKTRILSSQEYLSVPDLFTEGDTKKHPYKALMNLTLKFDPYSPNAEVEYEALREEIKKIDLLHLLNLELAKSRIHGAVTKKILTAIKAAQPKVKEATSITLMENLDTLFQIFPVVATTIKGIFPELSPGRRQKICKQFCTLINNKDRVTLPEINSAYILRILSQENLPETQEAVVTLYKNSSSALIRRDAILIMANWKNFSWLADLQNDYQSLGPWEKRAFIVASYFMGDAGSHWRNSQKRLFSPFEEVVRMWAAGKKDQEANWSIPI